MNRSTTHAHPRTRHRVLLGAASLAIAAGITAVPVVSAMALTPPPVISSLTLTPKLLAPASGQVKVSGAVKNAATCTISVTPTVPNFPVTFSCKGSTTSYWTRALLPTENSAAAPVHFKVTLTAKAGGLSATKTATVEVEAYHWSIAQRPLGSTALMRSLSCATTKVCVAVGTSGHAIVIDALGPHRSTVDGTHTLTSVSCAPGSPPFCVAVDDANQYLTYSGGKWSAPAAGGGGSGGTVAPAFTSVSCRLRESPTKATLGRSCVAGDAAGGATVMDFPLGQPAKLSPPVTTGLTGSTFAACSSDTSCVVADVDGDGVAYNGTTFSAPPVPIDLKGHVTAASCASDGSCVVVDSGGGAVSFSVSGGKWTVHVRESPTKASLRSVSCVVGLCAAVASDGSVYQSAASARSKYKGWDGTIKGKLKASDNVAAVSCALDKPTPLQLTCDFVSNGTSGHKDFKGHVTLLK